MKKRQSRRSVSFSAFMLAALLLATPCSFADSGIGFGWDEALTQELVYSVNLETGSASSTGVIDGLRFVATGSHAVDPQSGAALMIGLRDGNSAAAYLFLILPAEKKDL